MISILNKLLDVIMVLVINSNILFITEKEAVHEKSSKRNY